MVYTKKDNPRVRDIYFSGNTNWEFIFIHGYTGGTTDFKDLPEIIHREFKATVWCPMLPGHGTSIDELAGLTYEDIIAPVERHIAQKIKEGKNIVLLGVSFGAQAALYLSSQYAIRSVVSIGATHGFKFPLNMPGISLLLHLKRRWKKYFTPLEIELRAGAIFYSEMLSDGFFISRKLRFLVEANTKRIHQPLFFIHSSKEQLADYRAISELSRKVSSKKIVSRFFRNASHNMFYSNVKEGVVAEIVTFLKEVSLEDKSDSPKKHQKVSAIITAYNEALRIGKVLNALSRVPSINEIIVIDDGSSDNTWEVLKKFPKIRRLKNPENLGKGASMDRGVREAKNDFIFFCDADLIHFGPAHAKAIITPVLEGRYDMFIGMRGNFMQRTVKAWGLNSGERALHKKIWYALPQYYKHRYRIETGLNDYVRLNSQKGFGWQILDYSQALKESKYGFLRGTLLRWRMNFDVLSSYINRFFLKKE